jgi:hypothetical protein
MSEVQPEKKRRGRPKKVVAESPDTVEAIEKKTRGRPAKYAPEERQEKYKELRKNWQEENISKVVDANKRYFDRLKQSHKYLSMLIENNRITFIDDNEKQYVKTLFV